MPPEEKRVVEEIGSDDLESDVSDLPEDGEMETEESVEPEKPERTSKSGRDEVAELRKQLDVQQKRMKELEVSERYWEERASKGRTSEPASEPEQSEDEDEFSDLLEPEEEAGKEEPELEPDKFIDELTAKGPRALEKVIAKANKGYTKPADVVKLASEVARRIVANERGKITIDARLVSEANDLKEFGDLNDERSPLFRETQKLYREAVALDPKQATRPSAVLLALRAAGANLKAQAKASARRPEREEDEHQRRRIDAQRGETGRGLRQREEEDRDLGPEAQRVVSLFKTFGVNEDRYRKAKRA